MHNNKIIFSLEWLKGIYMNVPYSSYVMWCVGTVILAVGISFSLKMLIKSIAPNGLIK